MEEQVEVPTWESPKYLPTRRWGGKHSCPITSKTLRHRLRLAKWKTAASRAREGPNSFPSTMGAQLRVRGVSQAAGA